MVRSRVIDDEARTIASTRYGYDPLGRRALVQDNNAATLRTLYDGLGFDVVKESPVYASGGFTDTYNIGIQYSPAGYATGERYRYLDDGVSATSEKYQYIEDNAYQTVSSWYAGERIMLYAHGSPVAVNRSSGTRGYLGTDILGSTRSVTDNHGIQESYYDYDIFGSPVAGDFTTGADYGYLGKPYDSITGLYNYGYRDYSPQTVRFTTVDPIRDGSNWFAYVNNDPVNYVDLDGLMAVTVVAGTVATVSGGTIIVLGIVTAVVVADALSDGAVSAAISNFVDNVIEKRPVRDREGNPIPPGNQSPGPLGKKANAGPENVPDPSKLGEPGYIPPDNGPGGKIAAVAGLAALAYENRQQHPEFPQTSQEQNSGVWVFTNTNTNAEQRKEKKGK